MFDLFTRWAEEVWKRAVGLDRTLRAPKAALWPRLLDRHLKAVPYTRARLFRAMKENQPILFYDLKVPLAGRYERAGIPDTLRRSFSENQNFRVRTGPHATTRYLTLAAILDRLSSGRGIVSITDLHFRGSPLERRIDTSLLSDFNLLRCSDPLIAEQEIMTVVVSSKGAVTDSHTDDPDGSNHCFMGAKLWLAWDTFAGQARGLEDVSRTDVYGRAAFELPVFLSLKSARWWVVEANQTLFLPGGFAHKVLTLEPYIGVGSFYVALPSLLTTLERWTVHGPIWAQDDPNGDRADLVERIAAAALRKIVRLHRHGSPQAQDCWGLSFFINAFRQWQRTPPDRRLRAMLRYDSIRKLLETGRQLARY
jgi:hypothetical protein